MSLEYTPVEQIPEIHAKLLATFRSGKTKPIEWRRNQIIQVGYLLKDNLTRFEDALKKDLNRPVYESYFSEFQPSFNDVVKAAAEVTSWAAPIKPPFSATWQAMRRVVYKTPKGVVLIVSPFNYPVWLVLSPLVSALAAGCTVVVKASESTPATTALWTELIPKYLDPDAVQFVSGAVLETSKLLELPWGHILYTGSGRVGKIVAGAAAKTLTEVTLELGGKSPTILDASLFTPGRFSHLEVAARRILWGKTSNAGQTCVAPDYTIVVGGADNTKKFISVVKRILNEEFYPEKHPDGRPGGLNEDNFSAVVHPQSYKRIKGMLDRTKGTVEFGGPTGGEEDPQKRWLPLTVVSGVDKDDSLMEDEIFGPVLPIMTVDTIDQALDFINSRDHPLALYVFTQDESIKDKVFGSTMSGGACANEVMMHVVAEDLPFGGVGGSGYGRHTGKYGFDTFTHLKGTLYSRSWLDKILSMRYPPYTEKKFKRLPLLIPSLPPRPSPAPKGVLNGKAKWCLLLMTVLAAGVLTTSSGKNWALGFLLGLKSRLGLAE